MQSNTKEIYKLTAERTGGEEQTYKDIGNFVFTALYRQLRRPNSLIIRLRGIGYWYLRRLRMQAMVDLFPPNYELTREDFKEDYEYLKIENKREVYEIFQKRLVDYAEYIKEKKEIRDIRNKTQFLLTEVDDES